MNSHFQYIDQCIKWLFQKKMNLQFLWIGHHVEFILGLLCIFCLFCFFAKLLKKIFFLFSALFCFLVFINEKRNYILKILFHISLKRNNKFFDFLIFYYRYIQFCKVFSLQGLADNNQNNQIALRCYGRIIQAVRYVGGQIEKIVFRPSSETTARLMENGDFRLEFDDGALFFWTAIYRNVINNIKLSLKIIFCFNK